MRFSKDYKQRFNAYKAVLDQYQHAAIWKTYRKKLVRDGL